MMVDISDWFLSFVNVGKINNFIVPNGCKYIVVLMQYICCYKYVKQKLYNMKIEDLKNGFMIINGGKAEPLPDDLFDVPSKEREEEIIKQMTEDLRKEIDKVIDDKIKNT